jgi:hypothetical protein
MRIPETIVGAFAVAMLVVIYQSNHSQKQATPSPEGEILDIRREGAVTVSARPLPKVQPNDISNVHIDVSGCPDGREAQILWGPEKDKGPYSYQPLAASCRPGRKSGFGMEPCTDGKLPQVTRELSGGKSSIVMTCVPDRHPVTDAEMAMYSSEAVII